MVRQNLSLGLCLLIFLSWLLWITSGLPKDMSSGIIIGTKFLPTLLIAVLMILSSILVFQGLKEHLSKAAGSKKPFKVISVPQSIIILLTIGFGIALEYMGFWAATITYLTVTVFFLETKYKANIITNIVFVVIVGLVTYTFFSIILHTPLP